MRFETLTASVRHCGVVKIPKADEKLKELNLGVASPDFVPLVCIKNKILSRCPIPAHERSVVQWLR